MSTSASVQRFGPFELDPLRRRLVRDSRPVNVLPKEMDVLLLLTEHAGRVVEKEALVQAPGATSPSATTA